MAVLEVVVCDFCRTVGRPTETFEVCAEDAKLLRKLLADKGGETASTRPVKAPSSPRQGRRPQVVTVEEIERQKRAQGR